MYFSVILIVASLLLWGFHYYIFQDLHHILIYGIHDIAFVPLEVLLVTVVIHELLERRERRKIRENLNMLVGSFFSELGNDLLTTFSKYDRNFEEVREDLSIREDFNEEEFSKVKEKLKTYNSNIKVTEHELIELKKYLTENKGLLVNVLQNQNTLEHEPFTDTLWATYHLTEELEARKDISELPEEDIEHLEGDIERAYNDITERWIDYMEHQKEKYPYLFSLALRKNPFKKDSSPIIGQ
ncbi:MAG: putative membrane protein [Candidatus Methanohalarchaeum thermophilum]|uniref:Membrane protein n=1 Tax=Methanohalarchaeum thermophilum TaxID=1903181 RepID=A0A1Q6DW48_METT1|nr:MAG: putative membrane protein [Candidatus Methanohalarchaeum thermophilum]